MLIIRKNQTNDFVVSASQNRTLQNANYLFEFTHILSRETVSFYPQLILNNNRYDKFRFVEGPTDNLSLVPPQVNFPYLGQYYYSIYQSTGTTLNPSLTQGEIETGRCVVIVNNDQEQDFFYQSFQSNNENNQNIIFLTDEEQLYVSPVVPSPTPTNTQTPTTTPTQTPTLTPTLTQTPTYTPTETPTQTPTPSSTPPPIPIFNIGSGFDKDALTVYVDGTDVFVGGIFDGYDLTYSPGLVKLDDFGNLDTTFSANISSYSPQIASGASVFGMKKNLTNDHLFVWGGFSQNPLNSKMLKIDLSTGTNLFSGLGLTNNTITKLIEHPSGDLYVAGIFTSIQGQTRGRIAKLNSSGIVDLTAFTGAGFNGAVVDMILTRNGTLMCTGAFTTYNGLSANRIVEIELTTYTNTGFWGTGSSAANQNIFQRQDNGEFVIVGNNATINGTAVGKVSKFTEAGVNIPFTTALGGIVPKGLYLDEVNNWIYIDNLQGVMIRRYDYTTGAFDATFESFLAPVIPSFQYIPERSQVVQVNSNNKIYWVGPFTYIANQGFNRIIRLNQDGSINTTTS